MFSLGQKKYESIFEASSEMPFNTSKDSNTARIAVAENGKIVFANKEFLKLANLSAGKTRGQDFWTLIRFEGHDLKPQKIESGPHQIYINGNNAPFSFQFDWFETPESGRYLIGSKACKTTPYAAPSASHKNQEDNTNSDQTELNSNDIANFTGLSQEIMLVIDENGKIMRANAAFEDLLGYKAQEWQSINYTNLFEESERPAIKSAMRSAFLAREEESTTNTRPCMDVEAKIQSKSGQIHIMEWRQYYTNGTLYCTGRDITAIKAQEKELVKREKQLLQAESIGRMGHWRWVLDEDDIQWSQEIFRIFGVEENDFAPSLMSMNALVHRDDIDRVNQALQRAIIEENDYDVEFRINRPDGETRFIRSEGRCSRDETGEVIALFGIMQDMTERVLYEIELKGAKDAAERAYATKTQFLANMSHELRTPLNAIIGFSEMMERQLLGPLGNEKYLDYIGGIRESGEHLLDLISDILDMSKIEAGKYELMLEEINIAKTIKLSAHMMEGRALENNIKITLNTESIENIKTVADRRAVLQMLLNLLSNAVKFSKENGTIHMECEDRERSTIIIVKDNGIGIPANKLATITRPFEQVSTSYARDHEGSGLGLAITKELTEMHGGTLSIESKLGEGTTVTIRLPKEQAT